MSGASPPVMRLDGVSSVASIACSASLGRESADLLDDTLK
jgi:hypothetical protein